MLRADHPQTPIQVDSSQESWDRLRKKKNIFCRLGWPKLAPDPEMFLAYSPELSISTNEVEDWDPDRTSQRLLAR